MLQGVSGSGAVRTGMHTRQDNAAASPLASS